MNRASADLIKDRVFIQGISLTVQKLPILYGNVFEANVSEIEKIGGFLLIALKNSANNVPHPDFKNQKPKDEPLLVATGISSWKKMMQTSKNVCIDVQGDLADFLPTKFAGVKWGQTHLNAKKFSTPLDPLSLGQALIKAFELCE